MMRLAAYALILSGIYAALALVSSDAAQALTVGFIAAIVVPALPAEHRSPRRR
jgi:Na+/phosphate symporter